MQKIHLNEEIPNNDSNQMTFTFIIAQESAKKHFRQKRVHEQKKINKNFQRRNRRKNMPESTKIIYAEL